MMKVLEMKRFVIEERSDRGKVTAFDQSKNLFKDLKDSERVSEP